MASAVLRAADAVRNCTNRVSCISRGTAGLQIASIPCSACLTTMAIGAQVGFWMKQGGRNGHFCSAAHLLLRNQLNLALKLFVSAF